MKTIIYVLMVTFTNPNQYDFISGLYSYSKEGCETAKQRVLKNIGESISKIECVSVEIKQNS